MGEEMSYSMTRRCLCGVVVAIIMASVRPLHGQGSGPCCDPDSPIDQVICSSPGCWGQIYTRECDQAEYSGWLGQLNFVRCCASPRATYANKGGCFIAGPAQETIASVPREAFYVLDCSGNYVLASLPVET